MNLLTIGNPKIEKGTKRGYLTAILHLAPAKLSGFNVCPKATAGCAAACLNTAGRGGMGLDANGLNTIQRARIRKTRQVMNRGTRGEFLAMLVKDIERLQAKAARDGLTPAVRLNGTSDLRWETMPVTRNGAEYPHIFAAFPDLIFYDYTKLSNRRIDGIPNYSLTFSLADGNRNDAIAALRAGVNVAVVVRDPANPGRRKLNLPQVWIARDEHGRAIRKSIALTIDGDESDLRFLDPQGKRGRWVMLRAKGRAVKDTSGFVNDIEGIAS
jgi:hypothetical protein